MRRIDRFGNAIDLSVGYARGELLSSSADEVRRLRHAQTVAAEIVDRRGPGAIGIFTGNPRHFPLQPTDIATLAEEWVGPGLFAEDLRTTAIAHLGGAGDEDAAVFNRTTAGIIASVLALSGGRTVVSVVPHTDRSHASVVRGCYLAGVDLVEVEASGEPGASNEPVSTFGEHAPALVLVTPVSSSLARMDDDDIRAAVAGAKTSGATVLLDEAYGARLRPVLHHGAPSLSFGADLTITNTDKAGLSGPRAGVMAGDPGSLTAVLAQASEMGMEARAPIAAAALASLNAFDPEHLLAEARDGHLIADALVARLGEDVVIRTDLGPSVSEEDVFELALKMSELGHTERVPAEVTAAIGMLLLRDQGVLTVNTHGQPGARVSLRLKPTVEALAITGGVSTLVNALTAALEEVAARLDDSDWFSFLLFGQD